MEEAKKNEIKNECEKSKHLMGICTTRDLEYGRKRTWAPGNSSPKPLSARGPASPSATRRGGDGRGVSVSHPDPVGLRCTGTAAYQECGVLVEFSVWEDEEELRPIHRFCSRLQRMGYARREVPKITWTLNSNGGSV